MKCGRSSEILCKGHNTYLNLAECRGPQNMLRVCRVAWVVVEVVEPLWEAGHPTNLLKMLHTTVCSGSMYGCSESMYGSPCNGE
jgi:hypothetical protein